MLVAIMSGGDWHDASVEHLLVEHPERMEEYLDRWRAWYEETYLPRLRSKTLKARLTSSFTDWLLREGLATVPGEGDVLEFWEHP